jgi:ferric-dicitrate binding protein FerR (iron transport regulator)
MLLAGTSLRLDHDTRLMLVDAGHATLMRGAVYLDSGSSEPSAAQQLEIATPAGSVRHLGTQYEVRVLAAEGQSVQLAVREGRVELATTAGQRQWASAGQMLTIVAGTVTERAAIGSDDPRWEWVMSTTPQFDIDGHALYEFLHWVSRETGDRLVFDTPASEAEAHRVVLSGSVAGLQPVDALEAVLSTTHLRGIRQDGSLVISFSDEPRY